MRLVAVDGLAGSGKTTFGERLAGALGRHGRLVHTDDLLEGWADLGSFWPRLERWLLEPLSLGRTGRYRRYDWLAGRFGDTWYDVEPAPVLVLEGVTSARAAVSSRLTRAVWVELDPARCLARGIERDGPELLPEWQTWQQQESGHFAEDRTRDRADLVVDGAPVLPHDPAQEYVVLAR